MSINPSALRCHLSGAPAGHETDVVGSCEVQYRRQTVRRQKRLYLLSVQRLAIQPTINQGMIPGLDQCARNWTRGGDPLAGGASRAGCLLWEAINSSNSSSANEHGGRMNASAGQSV